VVDIVLLLRTAGWLCRAAKVATVLNVTTEVKTIIVRRTAAEVLGRYIIFFSLIEKYYGTRYLSGQ
jgi:hypothetical protein